MKIIHKLAIAGAMTITLAGGLANAQDKSILVQSTTSTANSSRICLASDLPSRMAADMGEGCR